MKQEQMGLRAVLLQGPDMQPWPNLHYPKQAFSTFDGD
jgi:hypothetical protein